jgi:hypothetical protein
MEIGKQISTGDFLVKGSKEEMALFKELFNGVRDKTILIAKRKEGNRILKSINSNFRNYFGEEELKTIKDIIKGRDSKHKKSKTC